jgi:adenylate kinase
MSGAVREIVIFIGPPGSGKGTVSSLCAKELGWVTVSAGNLCRKHVANKTKIGQEIDFAIKSGKLVTDNLITDMIAQWFIDMRNSARTVILDGFPRTVGQAKAFNDLLQKEGNVVTLKVVRFCAPESVVIDRLSSRFICQNKDCQTVYSIASDALRPKNNVVCDECGDAIGRRKDDEQEAVRERLKLYSRHEQELIDFYNQAGQLIHDVHVAKPLHVVFEDFKRVLGLLHND